jgi:hypothetical protein
MTALHENETIKALVAAATLMQPDAEKGLEELIRRGEEKGLDAEDVQTQLLYVMLEFLEEGETL